MRYQTYDLISQSTKALNNVYSLGHQIASHPSNPFSYTLLGKTISASFEAAYRSTKVYEKQAFGFDSVEIEGKDIAVSEQVILDKSFCQLRRFRRDADLVQPKVLVVAAMSGHHATLLTDTVGGLLADHDVYITDWRDARDVPLEEGSFGFDDYVSYLIEFMQALGPNSHMVAVCQPTVQALIATAVMAENKDPAAPKSLALMAGPIDTRIKPNIVNEYAVDHDLAWFERSVIMTVPHGYKGSGRKVYPGFLQLGSFMAMNLESHAKKHYDFFGNVVFGRHGQAQSHREFYDEYMAVLDMTAEFYLETLDRVFMEHHLARGMATYQGKLVDPTAIKKTALFTVEAENDDICSVGQTEAAQQLCSSIPKSKRKHWLQKGVGHYGVFSGSTFRKEIAPRLTQFIYKHH